MTIRSGYEGGIALASGDQLRCIFNVAPTGAYELVSIAPITKYFIPIQFGFTPTVRTWIGKENTLAVVAQTDTISLYVNDVFVLNTDRCGSRDLLIGLSANTSTTATDVEFTHPQGWQT